MGNSASAESMCAAASAGEIEWLRLHLHPDGQESSLDYTPQSESVCDKRATLSLAGRQDGRMVLTQVPMHSSTLFHATPLHFAAAKGHDNCVKLLLQCGANPNLRDAVSLDPPAEYMGNSPLHYAIGVNAISCAKLLVDAGADLNANGYKGNKPIHLVQSVQMLNLLLQSGANPLLKNDYNENALQFVAREHTSYIQQLRCVELVDALLAAGLPVDGTDRAGETALHVTPYPAVAKLLVENGADVHCKDSMGRTPLHTSSTPDVAAMLVTLGADTKALDDAGNLPNQAGRLAYLDSKEDLSEEV